MSSRRSFALWRSTRRPESGLLNKLVGGSCMKKLIILSFVCTFSVLMLAGCQRDEGVQAGNDQGNTGTYQPRPAPAPKGEVQQNQGQGQEMTGELQKVDMAAKTISVRVD